MKRHLPRTSAAQRALAAFSESKAASDLLCADLWFLENWESNPAPGAAAALRVGQIRRGNPQLAEEIRREVLRRSRS
jgi:hypothetical protein